MFYVPSGKQNFPIRKFYQFAQMEATSSANGEHAFSIKTVLNKWKAFSKNLRWFVNSKPACTRQLCTILGLVLPLVFYESLLQFLGSESPILPSGVKRLHS